jgi:hypothetical protein
MRSAEQIRRKPAEWADSQAIERQRQLRTLLAELRELRRDPPEWLVWLDARIARRHLHGLRDPQGKLLACPVPGCHAGRDDANPHLPARARSDRAAPRQPSS